MEIGIGSSTLFFKDYFQVVYGYENQKDWFDMVQNRLDEENVENVILELYDQNLFSNEEFNSRISTCDVFLIDGNVIPRHEFVFVIDQNKKDDAIIVLDNGVRNMFAYKFLKDNYYCLEFLRDDEEGGTETSVFFKRIDHKNKIFR